MQDFLGTFSYYEWLMLLLAIATIVGLPSGFYILFLRPRLQQRAGDHSNQAGRDIRISTKSAKNRSSSAN